MKNHGKWEKAEIVILCLLSVVGIVAIIKLGSILLGYFDGDSTYKTLQQYVLLPEEDNVSSKEADKQGTGQDASPTPDDMEADESGYVYYGQPPQVDFDALRAMNSEVTGWIYGPGTSINYPVVKGSDNSYYLTHMFDGKENNCGCIFMDCLNEPDFTNTNSIIHGHHMKNGSMFASLPGYSSQSYYDTHPVIWLITPGKSYRADIFTGFVTDAESDVWQIEFANKEDYRQWLDKMLSNSAFNSDIKPETDDKIITLATCSYDYDNARFVVMGILRELQ